MITVNEIYLQKKNKILFNVPSPAYRNRPLAAAFSANLSSLGYVLSANALEALGRCDDAYIVALYESVVPILKKMKGAHRRFKPMYPDFPAQVMQMDEVELYINAIIHYWSDGQYIPHTDIKERFPETEFSKLEPIDSGTKEDFESIFTNIVESKTSISASDKEIFKWFLNSYFPAPPKVNISYKENLAILGGFYLENKLNPESLIVKTATDVLRIVTSFSGGDVSLAENTKFKKLSRSQRRSVLAWLDKLEFSAARDEFINNRERFLRLGEILHAGEFKNRYGSAFVLFAIIRDKEDLKFHKKSSFNSRLEHALENRLNKSSLTLLKNRPGVFARRLDHLLRTSLPKEQRNIIDEFLSVAKKVSTPVLLQVSNHFKHRAGERIVFPKGNVAKLQVISPNELLAATKPQESLLRSLIVEGIDKILIKRFSALPQLGKVYVDPILKGFTVPFSQRSASKALKTISRGSSIPFDGDYNTIRFFVQWTQDDGNRVDIDLSAGMLNDNFDYVGDISFYNLRENYACHSGDIVNAPAPKGACEFIDINTQLALNRGRYVVMVIKSFNHIPFVKLPECFAGFMGRKNPNSGEIFEPRTVKNKFDIASDAKIMVPLIIDCMERKVIWADMTLASQSSNTYSANSKNIGQIAKAIVTMHKPNLYDLLLAHGKGRGGLCLNRKNAAKVFDQDFALEMNEICSQYLV